jgi:hypothetical protein
MSRRRAVEHDRRELEAAVARGGIRIGQAMLQRDPDFRGSREGVPQITVTDSEIVSVAGSCVVRVEWRAEAGRIDVTHWSER